MKNISSQTIQQIETELDKGNKIGAIKIYREATDVSLREAKETIEAWQNGQSPVRVEEVEMQEAKIETNVNYSFEGNPFQPSQKPVPSDEEIEKQVYIYLTNNEKLEAIKWIKTTKNISLSEAKDYVEAIEDRQKRESPQYPYQGTEITINEPPSEHEGKIEFHLTPITYTDTTERRTNSLKDRIALLLFLGLIAYLIFKFMN